MTEPAEPGAAPPARPEPLLQGVQNLLRELPGLIGDRVELASLELRRAGEALVRITVLVVAAAILGVTAWLALWAVLLAVLAQAGLHPLAALVLAALANLLAAAWAVQHARAMLRMLSLPATRRHLLFARPEATADEHAAESGAA